MSCTHTPRGALAVLVSAGLGLGVWGCNSDQVPTEPSVTDGNGSATAAPAAPAAEAVAATTSSPEVVSTVPMAGTPYGVAVSRHGVIYVAKIGTTKLARGNLASRSFSSNIFVGSTPPHVVFNPAGTTAYATLQTGRALVAVDVASNRLIKKVPLASDGFNLIVSPSGKRVYATTANGTLYVVNAATYHVITTLSVGPAANGLAWGPDGSVLYVSSRDAGTVVAINPANNTITRTYYLGGMPQRLAVAPNGSRLYVANETSGLNVVNLATGVVHSTSFGSPAYGLGITPRGSQIYVTLPETGEVRVLNRVSLEPVKTLQIGGTPRNVAFASDGTALVTNEKAVVFIQ